MSLSRWVRPVIFCLAPIAAVTTVVRCPEDIITPDVTPNAVRSVAANLSVAVVWIRTVNVVNRMTVWLKDAEKQSIANAG